MKLAPHTLLSSSELERKTRSPFLENLERRQTEENAIVHSLFAYFGSKLLLEDKELFSRAVDEVFAHSVLMSVSTEGDSQLVEELKEHLQANGLQVRQEVISKVKLFNTDRIVTIILLDLPVLFGFLLYPTG